jgi:hypothetical protein
VTDTSYQTLLACKHAEFVGGGTMSAGFWGGTMSVGCLGWQNVCRLLGVVQSLHAAGGGTMSA